MNVIEGEAFKDIVRNSLDYEIKKNLFFAYRFTKAQRDGFKHDVMFDVLCQSSAGISLEFYTTGDYIKFKFKKSSLSKLLMIGLKRLGFKKLLDMAIQSRNRINTYGQKTKIQDHLEVYIANQQVHSSTLKKNKVKIKFENPQKVSMNIRIVLPLYFPFGLKKIKSNGDLTPYHKKHKTWLALGDSITQGFNANQPSRNYVSRISNMLNLNAINQGVGGHYFDETNLIELPIKPDLITVLYGTNDYEVFEDIQVIKSNINTFFNKLNHLYPTTKIAVITPLWRKDYEDYLNITELSQIRKIIETEVKKYKQMTCIDGLNLIQADDQLYADGFLHPNQLGFEKMALSLREILMQYMNH